MSSALLPPRPSRFSSWLLSRSLGPPSVRRRLFRYARKHHSRRSTGSIAACYFGQPLLFPPQHDLVLLTNDLPWFNTPLRHLAASIRQQEGSLLMLDIGANVGEGVPLVDPGPSDFFWLVEGSPTFLPYLYKNTATLNNVHVFPVYIGESGGHLQGTERVVAGNAHIDRSAVGQIMTESIDRLFPPQALKVPNVMKMDIEGFEPKALRGGMAFLQRVQPAIHLEWYPQLLIREGATALAPLEILREVGYTDALLYDNHGYFYGSISLYEQERWEDLARYALHRDLFYFDLSIFTRRRQTLFEHMLAQERRPRR